MIDDLLTLLYFMQSHIVQAPAWVLDSLSPYEIKIFPRHLSVFAAWRQGSGVGASSCSPHLSWLGQVRWRCLPAGRSFCQGLPKKTMWNDPSRMKEPQEQVLLGVPQEQASPQRSRVWLLGTQPGCGVDQPFIHSGCGNAACLNPQLRQTISWSLFLSPCLGKNRFGNVHFWEGSGCITRQASIQPQLPQGE